MRLQKVGVWLLVSTMVLAPGVVALAGNLMPTSFSVLLNGKAITIRVLVNPGVGRSYAPAADLSPLLGLAMKPDADGVGADFSAGNRAIELFDGTDKAKVNGADASIDAGALTSDGVQYLPIRFVAEHMGYTVDWNASSQQVILTAPAAAKQPTTYTVTAPGDYFTPHVLNINVGDTVMFTNTDTDLHTVVTTPDAPAPIELAMTAGKQAPFTFQKPGVYHYYCSAHASYDNQSDMVKAVPTADQFPAAMEGIIVVQGPGFTGTNTASVDMPGDRYVPYITVVKAGGTVTFQNSDTDAHSVVNVPGAPENFQLVLPAGNKGSYTFTKPGIYEYYCTIHALWDTQGNEVKAVKTADAYPEPMAGVVVVLP